jgi:hypothetical protein
LKVSGFRVASSASPKIPVPQVISLTD